MNKLALFTLLVVCGAVYAADCSTATTAADCTAAGSSCVFTNGKSTCSNTCLGLNQADCATQVKATNCQVINEFCSVQVDCGVYDADATKCGQTTPCAYNKGADSSCALNLNPPVLANACAAKKADQATCEAGALCNFVQGQTCTYVTGQCQGNTTQETCTPTGATTAYCVWTAATSKCTDLDAPTGATACGQLNGCTGVTECAYTNDDTKNACNANATHCTANNADATKCDVNKDTPADGNCIWTAAVLPTCKNPNAATCTAAKTEANCTAGCKWNAASCDNTVASACLPDFTSDKCTSTGGKYCTFVQNGTCAAPTSNATILAVAGAFIALIAML